MPLSSLPGLPSEDTCSGHDTIVRSFGGTYTCQGGASWRLGGSADLFSMPKGLSKAIPIQLPLCVLFSSKRKSKGQEIKEKKDETRERRESPGARREQWKQGHCPSSGCPKPWQPLLASGGRNPSSCTWHILPFPSPTTGLRSIRSALKNTVPDYSHGTSDTGGKSAVVGLHH